MRTFLILGLPRSRTAWLSCLLTVGGVYCHHDLTGRSRTADEVIARMQGTKAKVCGNSDSGNLFVLDRVLEAMPETKLALVVRSPGDSARSMARITGLPPGMVAERMERLDRRHRDLLRGRHYHTIQFNDLDKELNARWLWEHLTGHDIPFPREHWERMRSMQVTIHDDSVRGGLTADQSEIVRHAQSILA